MQEPVYLGLDDVVALHDEILDRTGSPYSPLLHHDRLDSALHRPRQLAHHEPGADLIAQGVILAVAVSQAQAFSEGNKRAAFAAADSFLILNGLSYEGDPITFACWLICIAGNINDDDLDMTAEHLGLDLVAELDAMTRKEVIKHFDVWLRTRIRQSESP